MKDFWKCSSGLMIILFSCTDLLSQATNKLDSAGNIGIGTFYPKVNVHSIGTNAAASRYGNSSYFGGGRKSYSPVFGDQFGNGASYDSTNATTYGGFAGGYFSGGNGGVYAGGGAGIVVVGGNGYSGDDGSATGGAGLFATGGLNSDGSRTFSGFFNEGNVIVSKGRLGIGTVTPNTSFDAIGATNIISTYGNSTYRGGGKRAFSVIYGDQYGNGAAYASDNSTTFGGRAGGYFLGGNGGYYAGGAAGIVAIGGNGPMSDASTTGGSGIYAKGGLNGDGTTRTFSGFFGRR